MVLTTQNPYFSLNRLLLSRSMVFELKPLEAEDIKKILCRACTDVKRGLGAYQLEVTQEAIDHLTNCSQGDARIALNGLELAVLSSKPDARGVRVIDLQSWRNLCSVQHIVYDNTGDEHYDIVSAFIKSCGAQSRCYCVLFSTMLDAGEDPLFCAGGYVHAAKM